jgi:hypothetical protein
MGVRQTLLGRCIAFEPPRRLAVHNVTASGFTIAGVTVGQVSTSSASELLPEGNGTRLRALLDYSISAGFLSSVAERVAGPQMQADFDRSLQNLKRLLEHRPAGG